MRSATAWMGGLDSCAPSTIRTICCSVVSEPTLKACGQNTGCFLSVMRYVLHVTSYVLRITRCLLPVTCYLYL